MIVTVVPLVRLPKHVGLFSYTVPDELVDEIAVGQLITIPFRNSHIQGIVFSLQDVSASGKEKSIIDIIASIPLVSEEQLQLLATLSKLYGMSIATLTKMSVLPLQKTKLRKMTLVPFPSKQTRKKKIELHTYYSITGLHKTIHSLLKGASNQTLVLLPEIETLEKLLHSLPKKQQKKIVVWHSSLTTKQKFERWLRIRNGDAKIIFSSRGGVLLQFFSLSQILIVEEEHDQHKHWDQAPRFWVHDICDLRSVTTHLLTSSPRVTTYFAAYRNDIASHTIEPTPTNTPPTIIDIRGERAAHQYSCFSLSIEPTLLDAKQDVFIYLNRRGFASSLGCQRCGFVNSCSGCKLPMIYSKKKNLLVCNYCKKENAPVLVCPTCQSTMVKLRGAGTQLVESTLTSLLPNTTHTVIRIDSDTETPYTPNHSGPLMIVGTDKAFQHIRWERTELILFVDIDRELALPEYLATESLWHKVKQIQLHRNPTSTFAIQTRNPEHPFFMSIGDDDAFYRRELNIRHRLAYPPYSYLVKYFFGDANKKKAMQEAHRVYTLLSHTLTKEPRPVKLHNPLAMHPEYYRGKYWYAILVKIRPTEWKEQLLWLNAHIPPRWKIDPNPISILSP